MMEREREREREMSMHMYVYKTLYRYNRENAQRNLARYRERYGKLWRETTRKSK